MAYQKKNPSAEERKAHMDNMNKKAAAAHRKQTIEKIKAFLKESEAYFDTQDRLEQAYSEAGLANALRWQIARLQRHYGRWGWCRSAPESAGRPAARSS